MFKVHTVLLCFHKDKGLNQNTLGNTQHVWAMKFSLILDNKRAPKVTKVSYVMGKEQALLLTTANREARNVLDKS